MVEMFSLQGLFIRMILPLDLSIPKCLKYLLYIIIFKHNWYSIGKITLKISLK